MSEKMSVGVFAAVLLVSPCLALAQPAKVGQSPSGTHVLETPAGMTLYVYDGDQVNRGESKQSTCFAQCAAEWPPFMASKGAKPEGNWTTITRRDGKKQWAYKGRPVYTFSKDQAAGEVQGNGYDGNKWHIAQP